MVLLEMIRVGRDPAVASLGPYAPNVFSGSRISKGNDAELRAQVSSQGPGQSPVGRIPLGCLPA
jgi:hypothetical protein